VYLWLHENEVTAAKQLRLGDAVVLQDTTAAVHLHPAYKTWMNIVEQNCTSYNPDQLASALLATTHLFVDFNSSIVHRLLSETHKHLPHFTLSALSVLATTLKALPGHNDVLVRAMMKRVDILLANVESVSAMQLVMITTIYSQLKKFLSIDRQCHVVNWLLQMIENNKEVLLSPKCIEAYTRLGFVQSFKHDPSSRRLLAIGVEACERYVDQLDAAHFAKMCVLLHHGVKSEYFVRHVLNMLESHALSLLSDDMRLSEVIDLMQVLTRYTSHQVLLQFYDALHSRLLCNDYIDGYSLSSIARVMTKVRTVNTDLLMLFHHFIVEQAGNIVPYPHLFRSIERFLGLHCFLDKDLERQFNACLLSYVRRYIGVSTKYATAVVSTYLLPVTHDGLPSRVFKDVVRSVTQWTESALYKHTFRINSLLVRSLSSNYQLKTLNSALYQTLYKQLDMVDSLDSLHSVASSLLQHNCQQHPVITDRVMNMYTQYSSALSDSNIAWKIARIFSQVDYYLPSIYDDLVHYLVTTNESDTEALVKIFFVCLFIIVCVYNFQTFVKKKCN